jgi:hypothetical protein
MGKEGDKTATEEDFAEAMLYQQAISVDSIADAGGFVVE